ncbi:hypothetical protein [Cellulomonas endometrii]|uniref:hypothetical protein n=1 Tax=Cellulomonas endometrii TaxID=3036301 RepID=UPI0024ADB4A8|nr:hypothetical protein [Cellulomonas endometrii]
MTGTGTAGGRAADVVLLRELDPSGRGAVHATLDRAAGVLSPERRSFRVRPVALDRRAYAVVTAGRSQVQLTVERAAGWRRASVPLLDVRSGREAAQPADAVRALADALESRGVGNGARVVADLRAHAAHLERGGAVTSSPLARLVGLGGGGAISALG